MLIKLKKKLKLTWKLKNIKNWIPTVNKTKIKTKIGLTLTLNIQLFCSSFL